jgi:uncharacterized protein YdgA (DUF945 family)
MKKAIVSVVVLLFVTVLSIPFASGLLMERAVRNAVKEMNAIYTDSGFGSSLEIIDYQRHYLTSDIKWKIDLGPFKSLSNIEDIVFREHARHGFTGVISTTSLDNNPWYTIFVAEKLNGKDPVHITTQYGLLGGIESTVALDAFSVMVENETIDIKNASMVVATDRKLENFTSSGTWEGLVAGDRMTIGKTSLASTMKMFSPFIWDGDIRFNVKGLNAQDKNEHFELGDMKVQYLLHVNEDQTETALESLFSIEGLHTKTMQVDNASARVAINGIDVQAYEAFMHMYGQSMSQVLGSMSVVDENSAAALKQQMTMFGFQMMAACEKLLKKGLELNISDLNVKLADGEINGGIDLRLLKDMTFMQFAPIASQPELLFDVIYLKSDFSLPVNLVGENPKLIEPIFSGMQTGLFVRNGENLVHQAETVGGKLFVNSREVILPGQKEI